MPGFLIEENVYKAKNDERENPANYRPKTWLPTLYKIVTSIITHKIDKLLILNKILTEEQKDIENKIKVEKNN